MLYIYVERSQKSILQSICVLNKISGPKLIIISTTSILKLLDHLEKFPDPLSHFLMSFYPKVEKLDSPKQAEVASQWDRSHGTCGSGLGHRDELMGSNADRFGVGR